MMILAIIESTLAIKLIKITLDIVDRKLFLMIFHLSSCLFYEIMVNYMSKYFFNILYILEKLEKLKKNYRDLDLKGATYNA